MENDCSRRCCKISKEHTGAVDNRVISSERQHSARFKMPDTGQFNIGLTFYSFKAFLCFWIGMVHGCYILHSRSLNWPLLPFQETNSIGIVYESGKETDNSPEEPYSLRYDATCTGNESDVLDSQYYDDESSFDESESWVSQNRNKILLRLVRVSKHLSSTSFCKQKMGSNSMRVYESKQITGWRRMCYCVYGFQYDPPAM